MMTDQFGRTVVYNYKNGLLYHIKYFNGDSKFYTYDSCYNIKSITNQRGMTVHYKYDNLNRLVSWDNNFGEKETYLYDQAGNILCKTDAQNNKKNFFNIRPLEKYLIYKICEKMKFSMNCLNFLLGVDAGIVVAITLVVALIGIGGGIGIGILIYKSYAKRRSVE